MTRQEVQNLPNLPFSLDTWDNDPFKEEGVPNSLYYYAFDSYMVKNNTFPGTWIPPVDAIISVSANPYLKLEDCDIIKTAYDKRRFPVGNVEDGGTIDIKVAPQYRILKQNKSSSGLANFYPHEGLGRVSIKRDWRNEGKLFTYPYRYGVISDGLAPDLDFKFELCPLKGFSNYESTISVKYPLTATGMYHLYIPYYNDDIDGFRYGSTNTRAPQLPIVSSAYTSFMASNKAQMAQAKKNSMLQGTLGLGVAVAGAVAAPFTGGSSLAITAGVGSAILGGAGTALSAYQQISSLNATERDMADVPNRLTSHGNDGLFDLRKNSSPGTIWIYDYRQKAGFMQRVGDYFAMYGYAQKRIMKPDLRSRYDYNYIKTVGANVRATGVPKQHLQVIRAIFDKGTTIWHIDRPDSANVGDYSMDNYEVELFGAQALQERRDSNV